MTDHQMPSTGSPTISDSNAKEMRRLLHDMNNSLEIILQATYLVGTLDLGESGKQWVELLEKGVDQTASLNREFRDLLLRSHGE